MKLRLGKKLAELRTIFHYTQDELAEKLSVSTNTISSWETDQGSPSLNHLLMLTELYNVSLDDLVHTKDSQEHRFKRPHVPFRFICTTALGYYPGTYVDYIEDLESGLYTAWIWTTFYPYKRCLNVLPVKSVSFDDFISFVQDDADSYFNQYFEELEKLIPKEELSDRRDKLSVIAECEKIADTPYNVSDN